MAAFTYEIKKHVATITETHEGDYTLELNIISYNGNDPKYDLRKWDRKNDKMQKGITFTAEEAAKICQALKEEGF